ncbi:unnamed protein product, partial [Effrenium voratum]
VTSEQNIGEWLNARFFKAQYTHHENPADFFYESLRLGQETAEKQQPSALEFVGQFRQAVEIHNAATGKKLPLTQSLNHVVGAYNARVSVKRWRVDTNKRKIVWNLMRCPPTFGDKLAKHYDLHKHSVSGTAARPALASESVSVFMQKMYYSISETMPTGILPNNIELNSEEARATLLQQLMNQALEGPTTRLTHRDPRLLAKRELPPGSWSSMYLVYQAHCLACGTRPASRAVFYEVTKRWRHCLKFRSKSQHSTCLQCDRLRAQMRHSKSFMEHAAAADRLLGHLATTWRCRQVYWTAREQSRCKEGIVCIIIDGYDKSKPAIPRWTRGQPPKGGAFERVNRPHIQLSAALAHGHGCVVFLAEEQVSTGGSYTWESLLITINQVWKSCVSAGRSLPRAQPASNDRLCFIL